MNEYNKKQVGERIRERRKSFNLTQEDFAERIGRVPKFCADIERGQVGMSIETLLSICSLLKLTPNELLLPDSTIFTTENNTEIDMITSALQQCNDQQRKDAYALLKLFLTAIN
ncbi:helix-turn-helix domain-containing protein [Paenibacillus yanchengensis]|uniref:Helix-turn-helix domain-containing protein n=1 Tax=Paenibacillus yanchengensis TaxID=2035833 RepID=A0ABW4YFW2_9BACL